MRSAGFLTATACVLFVAMAATNSSQAQQRYVPMQVNAKQASVTQTNTTEAEARPAKAAVTSRAVLAQGAAHHMGTRAVGQATRGAQVFLLKGLADIFSSGMDKLAIKLQARGISARVASHASSDTIAAEVIARYRAGMRGPIIIAGHSLGADAAVSMSQRLNEAKVPVALVITFGPVGYPRVMGNVARAVNYFQANSAWHGQVEPGAGFRGSLTNIDLEKSADINHFNIEKADRIQADAIVKIVAAMNSGYRRPAPGATPTASAAPPKQKPAEAATAAAPAAPAREN